jgi:hypothetical protein
MSLAADARALARLRPRDVGATLRAAGELRRARAALAGDGLGAILDDPPEPAAGAAGLDPVRVAAAVRRVDRALPGGDRCLPSAVALQRLLAQEGHRGDLRIGVRRSEGEFGAHAWVELDGVPLLEPARVEDAYSPLLPASSGPFSLLGETIETDVPLRGAGRAPAGTAPTLRFSIEAAAGPPAGDEVARAPDVPDGSRPVWRLSRGAGFRRLLMPGGSEFDIDDGITRVVARPTHHGDAEACAQEFIGPALGVVVALRGRLVLHASAVELDGRALLFCGHSGGGKSTLSRSLSQGGMPLFSDDIVTVEDRSAEQVAHAGSRAQKLDPASPLGHGATDGPVARSRMKHWADHDGAGPVTLPIAGVFVIARGAPESAAEPLPGAEAFAALLPFNAIVGMLQPTTLGRETLAAQHDALGRLVSTVPVFSLRYPDGADGLAAAATAVRAAVGAP